MVDAIKYTPFLRKIHLFHDLDEEALLQVAERLTEVPFDKGELILEQGTPADSFYLIYRGKVRVARRFRERTQDLAVLVSGDYIGEMELFSRQGRSASVIAEEKTILLRFSKDNFNDILERYPSVMPNLEISITSRKLARTLRFKWLQPDEVVYFLARKHPIMLLRSMIAPFLALLLVIFLFVWGMLAQSSAAGIFGGLLTLIVLGWGVWSVIDWGNDYYIVTNKRAVWLEKVIGLYDSRKESPLTEILSVGVEADLIGRIFDYGNVLVRTFVGAIPFTAVSHPNQAALMVEEYWKRTQQVSDEAEKEAFKEALRQRLGLSPPPVEAEPPPPQKAKPIFQRVYKPSFLRIIGTNFFRLRYEDGGIITYRKHWIVLVRHILTPTVLLATLVGWLFMRLYVLATTPGMAVIQALSDGTRAIDTTVITVPLLMLPILGWWIYQYMDWSNDIFRVTGDQIMDIDRKPFGSEEKRAAPLDNILGTQYKREGIVGYIFNFGTVFIDIGSAQFTFEDVMDPASVQSDIDRRRLSRIADKKEADKKAERERMADWMATYHQNIDEFRNEQEKKGSKYE